MREIKFRAWDKNLNKFHYPDLWDNSMPSNWRYWYELNQWIGLKDKKRLREEARSWRSVAERLEREKQLKW